MTKQSITVAVCAAAVSLLLMRATLEAQAPNQATAAPSAATSPAGPSEGIKVHGRWTIDVLNPDGTLASHTEFNNALAPSAFGGASLLAQILGGRRSPGAWAVVIFGTGDASSSDWPCGVPPATPPNSSPCSIFEPNLLVSVPQAGAIELSGSFTVLSRNDYSPKVGRVETRLTSCNSATSSTACMTGPFDPSEQPQTLSLTSHTLQTAIPVVNNQIVQIKVVLTFS